VSAHGGAIISEVPGRQFVLRAASLGSIARGSPIYYAGGVAFDTPSIGRPARLPMKARRSRSMTDLPK